MIKTLLDKFSMNKITETDTESQRQVSRVPEHEERKESEDLLLRQISAEFSEDFLTEVKSFSEVQECNLNKKFRAILNVYVTKNNVILGLYDALDRHRLVPGGKDSGGCYTDRGTDKNSNKVIQQMLSTYESYFKELGIDHLTVNFIKGKSTKKSISTEKVCGKLLSLWKLSLEKYPQLIVNKCRKPHGFPPRRKGGKRGRRV